MFWCQAGARVAPRERDCGCEKGSGCLSVLAVGHGRSLLTDMYDAHLTKVWWLKVQVQPNYPLVLSQRS